MGFSRGVAWRPANGSDCEDLASFECADPPKVYKDPHRGYQKVHPRIWEIHAQRMIRDLVKQVAKNRGPSRGIHTQVMIDDQGLCGVASWSELQGPQNVHLDVVGIARRHRYDGTGGLIAQQIAQNVLGLIEANARAAGSAELYLHGEIHRENRGSQRLAKRYDFAIAETWESGAQTWELRVPLD